MSATTQDWPAFHTTETERRDWAPGYDRPDSLKRKPLLDKPTDPHPILSALMDEALLRIMLVSDGAVMALRERVTGSQSPGTPTSALAAMLDELGSRFAQCKTHRARLAIIKEAQTTGDLLRYAPRREQRGTREWKEAIGTDQRPCRIVASRYGVSLRDVVAYRKTFGVTKLAKAVALP